MAQEDKGLVIRGLILLGMIGSLVVVILFILFWRNEPPPPALETPIEYRVLLAITPVGEFPARVPWGALAQLDDTLPSAMGWDIRYNAAATLARRGSDKVPWPLIREMLDEKQQKRNCRIRVDGKDVVNTDAARANTLIALKAIAAWHEKRDKDRPSTLPSELREIYTQVDYLAENSGGEMKLQAEKAKLTFFK